MIKILIVTHGPLAQVLKESSAMLFGNISNDIETTGLYPTDNPEDLKEAICEKVEVISTGDGVLVLVNILAGSPLNMTALAIDELKEVHKLQCYTDVNMSFLMEALSSCNSMELNQLTTYLADIGRDTIANLHEALDIQKLLRR